LTVRSIGNVLGFGGDVTVAATAATDALAAAAQAPPQATSTPASDVGSTSATLNGVVNPEGSSTDARFEYGTTTAYGSQTSVEALGSGTTQLAVTAPLGGLQAGTTYHFRIVATNAADTANGADRTFTTAAAAAAPAPDATTGAA